MEKDLEGTYNLLDLAADDDLAGFKDAVLTCGANPHEISSWYHRQYARQKMGSHAVTPTMLASLYGSLNVLKFILSHTESHGRSAVTMMSSMDKATPLHYAVVGCSPHALDTVKLLLGYGADVNAVDAYGLRPLDVVNSSYKVSIEKAEMERLLAYESTSPSLLTALNYPNLDVDSTKYHPFEPAFTDAKSSIYTSDDFRMFSFKIRQCSRAYSHDWTECPFVHNGENARRRDPRKFHYSCVPCPEFRKGACRLGDACEYAHGIFESWLHPAQYRTRLCKDGIACTRRVCFFAHAKEELRPLYISSGSAVPSPRGPCVYDMSAPHGPVSPSSLCLVATYMEGRARDACMADASGKPNLKGPLRSEGGFQLKDSGAGVDVRANHDFFSMSSVNRVDCAFSIEDTSPSSPPLRERTTSKVISPLREHMQLYRSSSLQDQGQTRLDTLLHLSLPSQGCSPSQNPLHSRAQLPSPDGVSTYCGTSVQLRPHHQLPLFCNRGSPTNACYVEDELLNANMSSRLSSSCPIAASLSQSHGFSMSDWGSPTGKLEWGVQKEDLHRLRRISSNGRNAINCPAFCAASINVSKEGGNFNVANIDGSDSVLGFWLEQMQLDKIRI